MPVAHAPRFGVTIVPSRAPPPQSRRLLVCFGLRDGMQARGTLWRGRVLSTEAIHAVQALKSASKRGGDGKKAYVFKRWLERLIKSDIIAVLAELRRQNEVDLALEVFYYMRKEVWYKPDLSVYSDMILLLGKNRLIELTEGLFHELREDGLQPNTRLYTEMIGAFLRVNKVDKAMEFYRAMKKSGCKVHELTFTILIRNLEKAGECELSSSIRKDCWEYLEYPEKFLKEVDSTYPKRRSIKYV